MILQWAYLGMGIKATGIFCILLAAVLKPGPLSQEWNLAAGGYGVKFLLLLFSTKIPSLIYRKK